MLQKATIGTTPVGATPKGRRENNVMVWLDRTAVVLLIGLAGLSGIFAVLHGFAYFDESRWYGLVQVGMLGLVLAQLWAFTNAPRSPVRAGAIMLVSGLALAAMWGFLLPVAATALVAGAYGVFRANRYRQARQPRAAQ